MFSETATTDFLIDCLPVPAVFVSKDQIILKSNMMHHSSGAGSYVPGPGCSIKQNLVSKAENFDHFIEKILGEPGINHDKIFRFSSPQGHSSPFTIHGRCESNEGPILLTFEFFRPGIEDNNDRGLFSDGKELFFRYRLKPPRGFDYISPSVTEITGYTPEEHYKNPRLALDLVYPEDKEILSKIISPHESKRNFTIRWIRKDKKIIWTEHRNHYIKESNGNVIAIEGIVRDITNRKIAEKEIRESKTMLENFFSQSLYGFFFMMLEEPLLWNDSIDKSATLKKVYKTQFITRVNRAMLNQYGAEEDEFIGLTPGDFFADDYDYYHSIWMTLFNNGRLHTETVEYKFDGSPVRIEGDYIVLYDDEGRITGHFGIQRDITDEYKIKKELEVNKERLDLALTGADVGLWDWNIGTGEVYFSDIWLAKIGLSVDHPILQWQEWLNYVHPSEREMVKEKLEAHLNGKSPFYESEHRFLMKNGNWKWVLDRGMVCERDDTGKALRAAGTLLDITEKKQIQEELRALSFTDYLTGLYNRRFFFETLQHWIADAIRSGRNFSFCLIDLDHFKKINDTLGHQAGDDALIFFADFLSDEIRSCDILARFGGEEFVILLGDASGEEAAKIMTRISRKLKKQIIHLRNKESTTITFSAGIADLNELKDKKPEVFTLYADRRLYSAKNQGRDCIVWQDVNY